MNSLSGKHIDLSHISNIHDLDVEIIKVRQRIRQRETDLKISTGQIPKEAVRAAMGSVIPLFKTASLTDEAFKLIQIIFGGILASFITGKKTNGGFKKGLAETLRQVSFVGVLEVLSQLLGRKKKA